MDTRWHLPPHHLRGGFLPENQPDGSSPRDPAGRMDSSGFRAGDWMDDVDRALLDYG